MNVKQQEKGLMGSFSSWHNIVAACLDHSLCQEEQGKERCRKIDIQSTLSCPVLWFMIFVSDSWWAWRAVAVCTACCTSVTQPRSACQAASCRNCVTARSSTASWHCTANSPCRLIKQRQLLTTSVPVSQCPSSNTGLLYETSMLKGGPLHLHPARLFILK